MSSFGGGGGFGGFGQQNNNNQQSTGFGGFGASANNNNTTGGFGTTNNTGFGATNTAPATGGLFGGGASTAGGFGTSGFGANTASTGFGAARPAFGAPAGGTTATNTLFGGGGNNNNTATTTGGFGGFGGTPANSTTTGFGGAANSTTGNSMFGGGASNNTGFGASAGTGGFGSTTTTGGFGSAPAATGFGAAANTVFGGLSQNKRETQGTGGTPFQAHIEKDGPGNSNVHFQSITFQQPYTHFSFEELRVADYMQGRKYGNSNGQPGAFGTSTGFGGQAAGTGFGSTNTGSSMFSQNNNTATTGGFGATTTPSSGFGSNSSTGIFGAPKPAGTGMFGGSPAPATNNLFGNNNGQSTGTGFGGAPATGGFGASANTTNLFGQTNNNQAKPLFGATTSTNTGGFGSAPASGGFGAQPNTGAGMFGQSSTTNTGSPFGQQPAQSTTGFGGFGSNNTQNNNQAPSPFGGFGGTNNNQSNAPKTLFGAPSTGLGAFGSSAGTNNQAGSSPFGANNGQNANSLFPAKPATTGTGMFGQPQNNTTSSAGMFGGLSNNQQQQNTGGGMFGQNQDQTKNIFGSTTNTGSGGIFGNNGQNNLQQNGTLSFGNTLSNNQQQPQLGNSMFGNSLNNSQQSQGGQQLTTSIMASNPYGNDHLFVSLANSPQSVGPLATPLTGSTQKARKPAPLPPYRINPAASSRLITPQKRTGYGFSYSTYGTPGSAYGSPALGQSLLSSSTLNGTLGRSASTGSLRTYGAGDSILNPGAFSASPMRNFGGSGGMKKLRIDRSIRTDLFGVDGTSDAGRPSPLKKVVSFENDASQTNGTSQALVRTEDSDSAEPTPEEQGLLRSSRSGKAVSSSPASRNEDQQPQGNELAIVPEDGSPPPPPARASVSAEDNKRIVDHRDQIPGPYFMIPSKAELEKMSRAQLSSMKGFVVGREGVGKIEFHECDLSSVPFDKICGDIVRLDSRTATVYVETQSKPLVGKGLNVPSTVTLANSWPRSKGGSMPVYETKGPRFEKHLQRLHRVGGTKFIEYRTTTGEWVFGVDHFSTYRLDYEDEFVMAGALPGSFDASDMDIDMTNDGSEDDFRLNDSMETSQNLLPETTQSNGLDNTNAFGLGSAAGSHLDLADMEQSQTPVRAPTKSILKTTITNYGTPTRKPALEAGWNEQLIRTISPKKQDRRLLRESQGAILKELDFSKAAPSILDRESNPFATSIDVMKSLFGNNLALSTTHEKKQGSEGKGFQCPPAKKLKIDDAMLDTERAFRASFRPSWALGEGETQEGRPVESDAPLPAVVAWDPATSSILEKQKELTSVDLEEGVPFARLSNDFTFSKLAQPLNNSSAAVSNEKQMWELASILFDDLAGDDGVDEVTARKDKFSAFWKGLVESKALQQVEEATSSEEKAIAYLSAFNVDEATNVLQKGKDYRLAMMVAQIGDNEDSKQGMADQIAEWRRTNVISEFSLPIRALYELLAGNTCQSEGKTGDGSENRAETFNIGTRFKLDWRQVFGLKLWYGSSASGPLSEAVDAYENDLSSKKERNQPLPWFIKQSDAVEQQDILWGLLKVFGKNTGGAVMADLGEVLAPGNLTSNPTDARLTFHLYQFLRAKTIADFNDKGRADKADSIATDYAFQLSSSSTSSGTSLCDAAFVTLHLSSPSVRESAIKALLNRSAGHIGESPTTCPTFHTLSTDLKIPQAWIWSAKALHAKAVLEDRATEVRYLLRAGEVRQAHETLRTVVGPQTVIEEDLEGLRALISSFEEGCATAVEGWHQGGGIYADFTKLDVSKDKDERDALMSRLEAALPGLLRAGELEERVAVREMLDVVERTRAAAGEERRGPSLGEPGNEVYEDAVRLSDDYYMRLVAAM